MKKIFGYIIILICLVSISAFSGNAFAQEDETVVTGRIIEIAPEEHIIQVKDRNYIVTAVFVDDGITKEPVPDFFGNLKEGSVVELHVSGKYEGFWQAKEVILFVGEKEKEILKNME